MCYQSDDIMLVSDRGSLSTWRAITANHNNGEHHRWFKQVVNAQYAVTLEFFSALNIFLPITASLGNALILIGLDKVTSIYPQTKPFLSMSGGYWSLSISALDFLYNDSMQPKSSLVLQRWTLNVLKTIFTKFLEFQVGFFCVVFTLTLTAINGERLLALFFGVLFLVNWCFYRIDYFKLNLAGNDLRGELNQKGTRIFSLWQIRKTNLKLTAVQINARACIFPSHIINE